MVSPIFSGVLSTMVDQTTRKFDIKCSMHVLHQKKLIPQISHQVYMRICASTYPLVKIVEIPKTLLLCVLRLPAFSQASFLNLASKATIFCTHPIHFQLITYGNQVTVILCSGLNSLIRPN